MRNLLRSIFLAVLLGMSFPFLSMDVFAAEEYPLKGMYDDYFVISNNGSFLIMDDGSHVPVEPWLQWKWDDEYILRNVEFDGRPHEYAVQCAVRDNNPLYLNEIASVPLIAELAGPPWSDYARKGLSQETLNTNQEVISEIKKFYDSFPDWKTATDLEKAIHICKWISQAEYDYDLNDESYSLYGCLVNKKAVCQGYTSAARLLGTCVGLPVQCLSTLSHTYPIFLVNGVWMSYEPTSKAHYLEIAHVYEPGYYIWLDFLVRERGITRDDYLYNWEILYPLIDELRTSETGLNVVLDYCRSTNYTIPVTLDKELFPDQRYAVTYGKQVPIIYVR